jgi:LCP family protein required for cell wall assembly
MSTFFSQSKDNMKYLFADKNRLSPKKRRKRRRAIATVWGLVFVFIQLIAMILFMTQVIKLDMLPVKYLIMVTLILILLLLYDFTTQFTKSNVFGKILAVMLSGVMLFGFFFAAKVNTTLSRISNRAQQEGGVAANNKKVNEEPFIIYLSGMDDEGDVSLYGHSDVNIYAVCNPKTRQILLMSTPRDSFITITDGVKTGYDKLTHAGNKGIEYSMKALTGLYGISPDYYVRVNFTGCVNIVDALGGITINSEVEFTSGWEAWYDSYHYNIGPNKCNGQQTIAFVRERKAFDDGDFQRGRNQEAAVSAIIAQATSPAILMNYSDVLDSISDMMITNMPTSTISTLVKDQLTDSTSWNIQSYSVDGYTPDELLYGQVYDDTPPMNVVLPYKESINMAIELMNKTTAGDVFDVDSYVEQNLPTTKTTSINAATFGTLGY